MKLCFEELGHRNLTAKNGYLRVSCIHCSFVTVGCKKIHTSINFCLLFLQESAKIRLILAGFGIRSFTLLSLALVALLERATRAILS